MAEEELSIDDLRKLLELGDTRRNPTTEYSRVLIVIKENNLVEALPVLIDFIDRRKNFSNKHWSLKALEVIGGFTDQLAIDFLIDTLAPFE